MLLVVGFSLKLTVMMAFTLILAEFGLELTRACHSALATVKGPVDGAIYCQAIILIRLYLPDALIEIKSEALCGGVAACEDVREQREDSKNSQLEARPIGVLTAARLL